MAKQQTKDQDTQSARFVEAARQLGADEDEAAFKGWRRSSRAHLTNPGQ